MSTCRDHEFRDSSGGGGGRGFDRVDLGDVTTTEPTARPVLFCRPAIISLCEFFLLLLITCRNFLLFGLRAGRRVVVDDVNMTKE